MPVHKVIQGECICSLADQFPSPFSFRILAMSNELVETVSSRLGVGSLNEQSHASGWPEHSS